jgi:hypothetical protein
MGEKAKFLMSTVAVPLACDPPPVGIEDMGIDIDAMGDEAGPLGEPPPLVFELRDPHAVSETASAHDSPTPNRVRRMIRVPVRVAVMFAPSLRPSMRQA